MEMTKKIASVVGVGGVLTSVMAAPSAMATQAATDIAVLQEDAIAMAPAVIGVVVVIASLALAIKFLRKAS